MAVVNEVVADVADEVAEVATDVAEVSRGLVTRDFGFLFAGVAIGGGIGFLVTRKYLETKYDKLATEEIDEMREHFRSRLLAKEEQSSSVEDLAEKVEDLGYSAPNTPALAQKDSVLTDSQPEPDELAEIEEKAVEEVNSIFDTDDGSDPDQGWDYEEEVRLRRPEYPYVIHYDERGEKQFTETTLVYYEGDDVLCDEKDVVVEDKEKTVGETNLTKFGHGSNDRNVVYVRNDILSLDIEIVKNDGSYAEVVHGFVQHSDEPRRRRTFSDDD